MRLTVKAVAQQALEMGYELVYANSRNYILVNSSGARSQFRNLASVACFLTEATGSVFVPELTIRECQQLAAASGFVIQPMTARLHGLFYQSQLIATADASKVNELVKALPDFVKAIQEQEREAKTALETAGDEAVQIDSPATECRSKTPTLAGIREDIEEFIASAYKEKKDKAVLVEEVERFDRKTESALDFISALPEPRYSRKNIEIRELRWFLNESRNPDSLYCFDEIVTECKHIFLALGIRMTFIKGIYCLRHLRTILYRTDSLFELINVLPPTQEVRLVAQSNPFPLIDDSLGVGRPRLGNRGGEVKPLFDSYHFDDDANEFEDVEEVDDKPCHSSATLEEEFDQFAPELMEVW